MKNRLLPIVLLSGGLLLGAACDSKPEQGAPLASQPTAEHPSTAPSAVSATGPASNPSQPVRNATLLPDGTHLSFAELQHNLALRVVWEMYWHQGKSQKQIEAVAANPITVWRLKSREQDPMVFFYFIELQWQMTLWPDKSGGYDLWVNNVEKSDLPVQERIDTFSVILTPDIIQAVCRPATDFSVEMQHVRTTLSKPDQLQFIGQNGTVKSSSPRVWVGPKVEGIPEVYYYIEGGQYLGEMYIEDGTHRLVHEDYVLMVLDGVPTERKTAMYRLKKAGKSVVIKLNINRAASTQP